MSNSAPELSEAPTNERLSIWAQLEAVGLGEYAMRDRIDTMRALANSQGGPLSARRTEPGFEKRVVSVLEVIADRLGQQLDAKEQAARSPLQPIPFLTD